MVQPGDTLSSLSAAAGASLAQVQEVNCISDASQIQAFTSICLPVVPLRPQSADVSIAQACDRSTNTVTFTVTNNGGPMEAPVSARILDGFRSDLIAPAAFQLNTGQSQSFAFSYRTTPSYFGNVQLMPWRIQASTDCMPARPPDNPVIITATFTPTFTPPAPPAVFTTSTSCQLIDTCNDSCIDPIQRFTVTNGGGAMSTPDIARITHGYESPQLWGAYSFQLGAGASIDFDFNHDDADYFGPVTPAFLQQGSVLHGSDCAFLIWNRRRVRQGNMCRSTRGCLARRERKACGQACVLTSP
ncbi:MAG: LysM peptidoglycan-binding domain-containing protein [Anaerolineae bacterium]